MYQVILVLALDNEHKNMMELIGQLEIILILKDIKLQLQELKQRHCCLVGINNQGSQTIVKVMMVLLGLLGLVWQQQENHLQVGKQAQLHQLLELAEVQDQIVRQQKNFKV